MGLSPASGRNGDTAYRAYVEESIFGKRSGTLSDVAIHWSIWTLEQLPRTCTIHGNPIFIWGKRGGS